MTVTHDWPDVARSLGQALKPLRTGAPDAMSAFSGLARAALEPKALSTKAMGMSIYMGAGPSVMYAAQALEAFDQFNAKATASAA